MRGLKTLCCALALLLSVGISTTTGKLSAKAETCSNEQAMKIFSNQAEVQPLSDYYGYFDVDYSLKRPALSVDRDTYIFAVRYICIKGDGGNSLAFSNSEYFNFIKDYSSNGRYEQIAFPYPTGYDSMTLCVPSYYYFRTYDSTTNCYSNEFATTEHITQVGDGLQRIDYGYDCQMTPYACYDAPSTVNFVPQSFDKQYFVWEHGAGQVIVATISYQGHVANIKVNVPGIGLKTVNVILNNVKFSLRTGPNKCSIKCNSDNVFSADVKFAFKTVYKSDPILNSVAYA